MLNLVTDRDAHPFLRIFDILHSQGKFENLSKLHLVDGFHQMPLKAAHRHFTCTTTPKGVFQWTVLVIGLMNAGGQFQRMMEFVFRDTPTVNPYIDDVIIGPTGANMEKLVANYLADVTRVLKSKNKSTGLQSKLIELFPAGSGVLWACPKGGGSCSVAWEVATPAEVGATPNCDSFAQFFFWA